MIAPVFPKLALSEKWYMSWAIFRLPSMMIEDFYREINPPPYIREFSIQIKPRKTHYFEVNYLTLIVTIKGKASRLELGNPN